MKMFFEKIEISGQKRRNLFFYWESDTLCYNFFYLDNRLFKLFKCVLMHPNVSCLKKLFIYIEFFSLLLLYPLGVSHA